MGNRIIYAPAYIPKPEKCGATLTFEKEIASGILRELKNIQLKVTFNDFPFLRCLMRSIEKASNNEEGELGV